MDFAPLLKKSARQPNGRQRKDAGPDALDNVRQGGWAETSVDIIENLQPLMAPLVEQTRKQLIASSRGMNYLWKTMQGRLKAAMPGERLEPRFDVIDERVAPLDLAEPRHLLVTFHQRYVKVAGKLYLDSLKNALANGPLEQQLRHREMDLKAFRRMLARVGVVSTVEFSGRGEPMLNDDLWAMIDFAYQEVHARSRVVTGGHFLREKADRLLTSPLETLVVRLYGISPTGYYLGSGLDGRNFVDVLENLQYLLQKRAWGKSRLRVLVSLTVTDQNLTDIPKMIQYAQGLGVDGVIFEPFLSDDPMETRVRQLDLKNKKTVGYLRNLRTYLAEHTQFHVSLPFVGEITGDESPVNDGMIDGL
ncbi:MAG: hypothetical protein AB7P76_09575 [Candidatus Melainabacteria bacterium]